MKARAYPRGTDIGTSSVRGESILAEYQRRMPGAIAAHLIADLLAMIEVEHQVAHGEARAEGQWTNVPTADAVIDHAQQALAAMIREAEEESYN